MAQPTSGFASNVLKLTTGSTIAQAVGILATPIVARLFAPEAFGYAGIFTSITSVVSVLACLRYELSIMLPKRNEEAANLLVLSMCAVLLVTASTALIVFVAGGFISSFFNSPRLEKYLWLVPIAVFIEGHLLAFNFWNTRTKRFGRLSLARVLSSIFDNTMRLGAGFAGFVSGGVLITATIFGQLVSTMFLGCTTWRKDRGWLLGSIHLKTMMAGLKRHRKFPIYSTWSTVLNSISQQLPLLFLAHFFPPQTVGFFNLSRKMLYLPMNLIGLSIGKVFFQKATEAQHQGELSTVVEEVFKRLVSLGILPFLIFTIIGKELFIFAFGARWAEAGVYAQILGVLFLLGFIYSPLGTLFSVLEKQGVGLVFNIILLVTGTVALSCGGLTGDSRTALVFFSGSGALVLFFRLSWILSRAGLPLSRQFHHTLRYVALCSPMIIITLIAKLTLPSKPLPVILVGGFVGLAYYLMVLKHDQDLQAPIRTLFRRLGLAKRS